MFEAYRETLCTSCIHKDVCKNKETYLKICECVRDVKIYEQENETIKKSRIANIPWISINDPLCMNYAEEPRIKGSIIWSGLSESTLEELSRNE